MALNKEYLDQYLEELVQYCKDTCSIDSVYLFGSVARSTPNKLSDIDFGILLNDKININGYFNFRLKLIQNFSKIIRTDKIDIIILNTAPNILAHEIIAHNNILFSMNEKRRIEFEVSIINQYLDFKPFLRIQMKYMKEQIYKGDFFDQ